MEGKKAAVSVSKDGMLAATFLDKPVIGKVPRLSLSLLPNSKLSLPPAKVCGNSSSLTHTHAVTFPPLASTLHASGPQRRLVPPPDFSHAGVVDDYRGGGVVELITASSLSCRGPPLSRPTAATETPYRGGCVGGYSGWNSLVVKANNRGGGLSIRLMVGAVLGAVGGGQERGGRGSGSVVEESAMLVIKIIECGGGNRIVW